MIANAMKRFLSLMLALAMVISVIPGTALTASAAISEGDLTVTNLGATATDGNNSSKFTASGTTITGVATGADGSCGGSASTASAKLVLTNNYGSSATLSFTYSLNNPGTAVFTTSDGTAQTISNTTSNQAYKLTLAAGGTLTIDLTSQASSATTTLTLTNVALTPPETISTTFAPPAEGGSYTVDGTAVTSNTTLSKESTESYAVVAAPASGYSFFGWYSSEEGYLSYDASASLTVTKAATITPKFISSSAALFEAGGTLFYDLNDAVSYAQGSGITQINLYKSGTITGNYTIPAGITLLIPFDEANTCYTTVPEYIDKDSNTWVKPTAYRTLTMDGASIVVNGAISVSAKHAICQGGKVYGGTPSGSIGHIRMKNGSTITVNQNGALYAWGYITGDYALSDTDKATAADWQVEHGSITAKNGAAVYENMQVTDFRGGSVTGSIRTGDVFPFSQYYVQNIEVPLTLEYGAEEHVYTTVRGGLGSIVVAQGTSVKFIGANGGMFTPESGTTVVKKYDGSTDRLILDVYGGMSMRDLTLDFNGSTYTSSDYILPITNNISINIHSGTATLSQDIQFQPGAEMYLADGTEVVIASGTSAQGNAGYNLYVFDVDQWKNNYVMNSRFIPLGYAPGKVYTRQASDLKDVIVTVNGSVTVNGYLYTTEGGADITSDGNGRITFKNGAGDKTTVPLIQNNSTSYVSEPITPAKLHNADGSYTTTADAVAGDSYGWHQILNRWIKMQDVTVTYNINDGSETPATMEQTVDKEDVLAGFELLDDTNSFNRDGYKLTGWKADYTATNEETGVEETRSITYALGATVPTSATPFHEFISPDTTPVLYAQWQGLPYDITVYDADGTTVLYTATLNCGDALDFAAIVDAIKAEKKLGYELVQWTDMSGNVIDTATYPTMPVNGLALTSSWTKGNYTITFDTAGGTEIPAITQEFESAVTWPQDPTKTGHTFSDWSILGESGKAYTLEQMATMPGENVTATAQWTPIGYTVTYADTYETAYDAATLHYGDALPAAADPVRTGYSFTGWKITTAAGAEYTGTTMPAEDLTYTAQWSINQYTITFDSNGGSAVSAMTQDYNSAVTEPAAPTRTGYSFKGWSPAVPTTMPAENITVVAQWEADDVNYTVETYIMDTTGAYGEAQTETGTAKTDTTAKLSPEARTGFAVDTAASVLEGNVEGDGSLVLKVYYSRNQYTFQAVVDGVTTVEEQYYYEETVQTPESPEKAGYAFTGWSPAVPGTMPAENVTAVAQWNALDVNYTVKTYTMDTTGAYGEPVTETKTAKTDTTAVVTPEARTGFAVADSSVLSGTVAGDGSLVLEVYYSRNQYTFKTVVEGVETAQNYYYEQAVTAPADPVKTGWTFNGWDGEIPVTMPANDVTLTADLTVNRYTIVINENGGDALENITADYESTVTLPVPTRTGYEFTGWQDSEGNAVTSPVTMPLDGMTVTAQWNALDVNYTVEIYTMDTTGAYGEPVVETKTAKTDTTAVFTPESRTGFTVDMDASVLESNVAGDGSLVLKVYYIRSQYAFKTVVDGAETTVNYYYEQTVAAPADPDKEGHTFTGWDGDIPATMPANDVTLTAQFTINQYTIRFDSDGGSAVADITQNYGSAVEAPADPTRAGYRFDGWSPAVPTTMPAADTDVKAQWTALEVPYTVKTYVMGIDGVYGEPAVETRNQTTDTLAEVIPEEKTGFTVADRSVLSGNVEGDGSLVLEVYYSRDQYTFQAIVDGETTVDETYYYEAPVAAPADPDKEGYSFTGWGADVPETMPAEDVTLTAQWQINTWNVTLYSLYTNEIDNLVFKSFSAEYGTAIDQTEPVRTGYTFKGWATLDGITATLPATVPDNNVTLVAKWEINRYTVTWNIDGETQVDTYDYDAAITKETAPAKTGYSFAGWTVTGDQGGTYTQIPANMPAENLTITAEYTINQYTVKFVDAETGDVYKEITADYGTAITAPADPEKEGYLFTGWDTDIPDAIPAGDLTIAAKWEIQLFTITFDTDGGTTVNPITDYYGEAVTEPDDPIRKGHTFLYWMDEEGNETAVPATIPGKNITLTAKWQINSYTVTFDTDGGETMEAITADYGTAITIGTPVRTGHTFLGWIDTGRADAAVAVGETTMPEDGMALKATWQINSYTVTFDTDGGEAMQDITADYQAAITIGTPVKTGHTFLGWIDTGRENAEVAVGQTVMPENGMTLKAQWQINRYTITFSNTGDAEIPAIEQDYGTAIAAVADPVKTGYEFTGWLIITEDGSNFDGIPATMPATNLKVYGQFKAIDYTITFAETGDTQMTALTRQYRDAIGEIAEPTKVGHTFLNWVVTNESGDVYESIPASMPAENLIYTAQWDVNEYTVTFDVDGGEEMEAITADYGTPITIGEPVRTGYTFQGWIDTGRNDASVAVGETVMPENGMALKATWQIITYTIGWDTDGDGTVDETEGVDYGNVPAHADGSKASDPQFHYAFTGWLPAITAAEDDVTYTAQFDNILRQYDITFVDEDGTVLKATETLDYGTVITAPADPEKADTREYYYDFAGWDSNGDGVVEEITTVTGEATYTAVYSRDGVPYNIIWDTNDNNELEEDEIVSVKFGDPIVPPEAKPKEGYSFVGWSAEVPATMPAKHMMFSAVYEINTYTIYFGTDGGSGVENGKYEFGAQVSAPEAPTKSGFEFLGWQYADGTDVVFPFSMPASDLSLKAIWQRSLATIVFHTNGGTAMEPVRADADAQVEAPAQERMTTRTGYTFGGWYDNEELTGSEITFPLAMPAEGMELYAKWTANAYEVTFDGNGGMSGDLAETVRMLTFDEAYDLTQLEEFRREGYRFLGWADSADAAEPAYTDSYTHVTDSTLTLYAVWQIQQYTITFDTDGGTAVAPITADYGTEITAPAAPEKEGYTFGGWENLPEKMPASDTAVKALWTINSYTITFADTGDEAYAAITQDYGTDISAVAEPEKTGYKFLGWDTEIPATMPAEDLTITALWEVLSYTITFADTGDEAYAAITQDYGTDISAVAEPEKTGYKFLGWDTEIPATMPAENLTITARWEILSYTITFADTGDEAYAAITQEYGTDISAVAEPEKTGYTFLGWDTEIPATMPAENLTITALWEIRQFTVTFDTDGGSDVEAVKADFGTSVRKPADPEKEGHTFGGWTYQDGSEASFPITIPAEDLTLKAVWTVNSYTITFNTDGGSAVGAMKVPYGEAVTVTEVPEKTGHTFAGWEGLPETMPASAVTVKALWTINQYTITFVTDGGTEIQPITADYGAAVSAPANPTREGSTFSRWSRAIPATMPAEDLTITAIWNLNNYTVSFDTDGGSAVAPITQAYGTPITAPGDPTRTGYTFAGWSPELPETMPAGNTTVKALWTVNQYTITFRTADGTVALTADYGAPVSAPKDPTREGYTFDGWDTEIPATMPARNMIITAKWVINGYTITFDTDGGTEVPDITAEYGAAVTAPAAPAKEGYTFAGWSPEVPAAMPGSDLTVKALWTINQYTITFDTDGGSAVESITADYNSWIKVPAAPTKEGYTFAGWSPALPERMEAKDQTLTAQWTANSYAVSWYVDGALLQTGNCEYGTEILQPAAPTKEGYTFAGWTPEVPATMPARNQIFMATWTINSYDVTWIMNDTSETATYEYRQSITKLPNPTREGHTFAGWQVTGETGSYSYIPNRMPAEDLTITALWTPNSYTITWIVDGEATKTSYTYGEAVTAPAGMTKEGHTFDQWDQEVPAVMGAEDLTITALWTVNQYTITFDSNGGSDVEAITQDYGTDITAPVAPERDGYSFTGWTPELPGTMPAEDLTLTAQWDPDDYVITFHANDGTGAAVQQTVEHAVEEALDKNTFTREGYGFMGWAADPDSQEVLYEDGAAVVLTSGVELYAIWQEGMYTVTFESNDALYDTRNAEFGSQVEAPAAPALEGHTFGGWQDEEGNMISWPLTMPARNMTLTAVWNLNYYTIRWNVDGTITETQVAHGQIPVYEGTPVKESTAQYDYTFESWDTEPVAATGDAVYTAKFSAAKRSYTITFETGTDAQIPAQTLEYGSEISLSQLPALTKEGHSFGGWGTTAWATGAVADPYRVTGEATLYAIWTVNMYQISFVDGFGSTTTSRQYYGTPVTAPADPEQEGYTFDGWDTEIPATMPARDMTIRAKWIRNIFTITFDSDGGSAVEAITANYGTAITAPVAPTREGYTFAGWSPALPATMPAEDLTLTAQWKINEYSIHWDLDGDGTVDDTTTVTHGTVPVHADGSKAADAQYTYTFSDWTPAVEAATRDQVYTAVFTTTTNTYAIGWDYDGDGTADDTTTVAYGTVPNHGDVTKENDERYTYTFAGWSPALAEVTGEAMYTAQFAATPVAYTFYFLDVDGGVIDSVTTGYGTAVEVPAAPEKAGYTFNGWEGEIPATMPVNGGSVTAKWIVNSYTITFDSAGGTRVDTIYQAFGSAVVAPDAPTKTGYSFGGWLPAVPATMPAENMTLTAQWIPNPYTITFNTAGGSEVSSITQDFGSAVTAPDAPTREGYTFAGWDTEIPATMPAENMTITARWTANSYSITFYTDDSAAEVHTVVTADCDSPVSKPADPTREGYTFGGWTDGSGEIVSIPATMPAGGAQLYATWNVDSFTILFDGNGGSTVEPIVAEYGADLSGVVVEEPTREGYTFDGWDQELPATMPARTVTITALWKVNQYTITFDTAGGTPIASITQDYNTAVTAPAENPTKLGYSFAGWDMEIPSIMPAQDVTIHAQWTPNSYTITFNTNGGTAIEPITAEYGTAVERPADPEKTGYTFAGWDAEFPETMPADGLTLNATWAAIAYAIHWDTDGDGDVDDTTQVDYDTMPVHADGAKPAVAEYHYVFSGWDPEVSIVRGTATYTALFDAIPNEYTITFDSNGGSAVEPATYAYGAAVLEPAAPTKEGYTFAGWDALPGTMPARNVKVVAQWRAVEYTITFDSAGGTAVAPVTAGYGTIIAAPNAPTREGYTFTGWTPAFPETMPLNGAKLTASWSVNQYTITFDTAGGSEVASITQDYGTAITMPADPVREGYTFIGWNAKIPATMPAADMTFTAQWEYTYSGWLTDDVGTTYLVNGQTAYYAQWANLDGDDYYFDSEGYIVKGLYQTWSMDDTYEATFVFDKETGIFQKDLTTIYTDGEDMYYVENGEVIHYPGLVRIVLDSGEINYYYFGADNKVVKGGTFEVTQTNGLLPADPYTFDDNGVIVHHEDTSRNGIHEENGRKFYYIDGVKVHMGLVQIGEDYYYATVGGEIVCGCDYWITRTNDLLPEKSYTFDEEGRIVFEPEEPEDPTDPTEPEDPTDPTEPGETEPAEPEKKNGIYAEDGSLYYYEDGERTFAGLFWMNGYYYYAKANGEIIHSRSYWITKTNGLMEQMSYAFDEKGRMILEDETEDPTGPVDPSEPADPEDPTEPVKNGIYAEDGSLYYYVGGQRTYAGLIELDGYYYYVRSGGEVVHSRSYWITRTNGLLPEKSYTFDDQGRMTDLTPEQRDPDKNGIYAEDGSLYYYVKGLRTYAGLIELDGYYYYVRANGEVVNGRSYWITKTNGLMPEQYAAFDAQGRMIIEVPEEPTEPVKSGIYAEDGSLFYYENGERTYAGLIILDGYFYYVRTSGELAHSCDYWITKTNGLLPEKLYTFDEQGRIVDVRPEDADEKKNGIYEEDGVLYYYEDGYKAYGGLVLIDGSYYYAKSTGALVCGRKYYVTKTNGLMEEGYYTFAADGKMVL